MIENTKPNQAKKHPLKLMLNRVCRSYSGGLLIDQWQGAADPKDSDQPEEWLSSLVEARNSKPKPGEGLSQVLLNDGSEVGLLDLIRQNPIYYLGAKHLMKYGDSMAVLTKVLDAAVRLSIQVHPTKAYARKFFNSDYGKTEAWYILGGRQIGDEQPYVLAGFKPGMTREIWKQYFEEQDINGMIDGLHKIEVKAGDVVLIEGGFPHAIGSGCFLIEIQEPTDYTMRIERTTFDGGTLPDMLCHQGVGFDHMLDCFTYEALPEKETREKCFKTTSPIRKENGGILYSLISEKDTPCFAMDKLVVTKSFTLSGTFFRTLIILSGAGFMHVDGQVYPVGQGESFFLPSGMGEALISNTNETSLEIIICYPPKS